MTGVVVPVEVDAKDSNKKLEEINKNLQKLGLGGEAVAKSLKAALRLPSSKVGETIKEQAEGLGMLKRAYESTFKTAKSSMKDTNSVAKELIGTLRTMVKVGAAVALGASLAKVSDDYTMLSNKLKLVTQDMQDVLGIQNKINTMSLRNHSVLRDGVEVYFNFARALEESSISSTRMLKVTSLVQKTIAISNTPVESAKAALIQLGQGLAAARLSGQEFNSVAEQIPALAQAIAKGMGVAYGDLRKVANEGGLDAEVVLQSLEKAAGYIEKQFAKTTGTISQGAAQASQAVKQLVAEVMRLSEINSIVYNAFNKLATSLVEVSISMESAFNAVGSELYDFLGIVDQLALRQNTLFAFQRAIGGFFGFSYLFDNLSVAVATLKERWGGLKEDLSVDMAIKSTESLSESLAKVADLVVAIGTLFVHMAESVVSVMPRMRIPIVQQFTYAYIQIMSGLGMLEVGMAKSLRPFINTIDAITDAATLFIATNSSIERSIVAILKSNSIEELTAGFYTFSDAMDRTSRNRFVVTATVIADKINNLVYQIRLAGVFTGLFRNDLIYLSNIRFDQLFRGLATVKRTFNRVFTDIIVQKYGFQLISIWKNYSMMVAAYTDAFVDTFIEGNPALAGADLGDWMVRLFKRALFTFKANFQNAGIDWKGIFLTVFHVSQFISDLVPTFTLFLIGFINALEIDSAMIRLFDKIAELANSSLGESFGGKIAESLREGFEIRIETIKASLDGLSKIDVSRLITHGLAALDAVLVGLSKTIVGFLKTTADMPAVASLGTTILGYVIKSLEDINFYAIGFAVGHMVRRLIVAFEKVIDSVKSLDFNKLFDLDSNTVLSKLRIIVKRIFEGIKKFIAGYKMGFATTGFLAQYFDLDPTKFDLSKLVGSEWGYALKTFGSAIVNAGGLVLETIMELYTAISGWVKKVYSVFTTIFSAIAKVVSFLGTTLVSTIALVEKVVVSSMKAITGVFNTLGGGITGAAENIGAAVGIIEVSRLDAFMRALGTFDVAALVASLDKVAKIVETLVASIFISFKKLVSVLPALLKSFGASVVNVFKVIYEEVVGHSYWPDTIDGINRHATHLSIAMTKVREFGKYVQDVFKKLAKGETVDFATPILNAFESLASTLPGAFDKLTTEIGAMFVELTFFLAKFEHGLLIFVLHRTFMLLDTETTVLSEGLVTSMSKKLTAIITEELKNTVATIGKALRLAGTMLPDIFAEFVASFGSIGEGIANAFIELPKTIQITLIAGIAIALGVFGKTIRGLFATWVMMPLMAEIGALGALFTGLVSAVLGGFSSGNRKKMSGSLLAWLFGSLGPRGLVAAITATTLAVITGVASASAALSTGVPLMMLAVYGANSQGINRLIIDTFKIIGRGIATGLNIRLGGSGSGGFFNRLLTSLRRDLIMFRRRWSQYSRGSITIDQLFNFNSSAVSRDIGILVRALADGLGRAKTWIAAKWVDFTYWLGSSWGSLKVRWQRSTFFADLWTNIGLELLVLRSRISLAVADFRVWLAGIFAPIMAAVPHFLPIFATLAVGAILFTSVFSNSAMAADGLNTSVVDLTSSLYGLGATIVTYTLLGQTFISVYKMVLAYTKAKNLAKQSGKDWNMPYELGKAIGAELAVLKTRYGLLGKIISVPFTLASTAVKLLLEDLGRLKGFKWMQKIPGLDFTHEATTMKLLKWTWAQIVIWYDNGFTQLLKNFWKWVMGITAGLGIVDKAIKLLMFGWKAFVAAIIATTAFGVIDALFFGDTDSFAVNLARTFQSYLHFIGLVEKPTKLGVQDALELTLKRARNVGFAIFDFQEAIDKIDFSALTMSETRQLKEGTGKNVAKIEGYKELMMGRDQKALNKEELEGLRKTVQAQRLLLESMPAKGTRIDLGKVSKALTEAAVQSPIEIMKTITNLSPRLPKGRFMDSLKQSTLLFTDIADNWDRWQSPFAEKAAVTLAKNLEVELDKEMQKVDLVQDGPGWISNRLEDAFKVPAEVYSNALAENLIKPLEDTMGMSFRDAIGLNTNLSTVTPPTGGYASFRKMNSFQLEPDPNIAKGFKKTLEKQLDDQMKNVVVERDPRWWVTRKLDTFVGDMFAPLMVNLRMPWKVLSTEFNGWFEKTFTPSPVNQNLLKVTAENVEKAFKNLDYMPRGSFKEGTKEAGILVDMIHTYRTTMNKSAEEQEEFGQRISDQANRVNDLADAFNKAAVNQKEMMNNSDKQMVEYEGIRKFVEGTVNYLDTATGPVGWALNPNINPVAKQINFKEHTKNFNLGLEGAYTNEGMKSLQDLRSQVEEARKELVGLELGSNRGILLRFKIIGLDQAKKEVADLDKAMAFLGGSSDEILKVFTILDEQKLEFIRKSDYFLFKELRDISKQILEKRIQIRNTPVSNPTAIDKLDDELTKLTKQRDMLINGTLIPRIPDASIKDLNEKMESLNPNFEFKFTKEVLAANPEMATLVKAVWSLNEEAKKFQFANQLEEAAKQGMRVAEALKLIKEKNEDQIAETPKSLATAMGVKESTLARSPVMLEQAQNAYKKLIFAQRAFAVKGLSAVSNQANAEYLAEAERAYESLKEVISKIDQDAKDAKDKAGEKDAKTYSEAFEKQMKASGLKGLDFSEYAGLANVNKAKVDQIIKSATEHNAVIEKAPAGDINFKDKEISNHVTMVERLNKELQKTVALDKLRYRTFNDMMSSMGEVFEGFSISDWFRLDPGVLDGFIKLDNRIQKLKLDTRPLKDMSRKDVEDVAKELRDIERQKRQNKYNNAGYGTMMEQSGIDPQVYNRVGEEARNKIFQLQNLIAESEIERKTATGLNLSLLQQTIEESKIELDNAMLEAFSDMPFEASKAALKQAGISFGTDLGKLSNEQLKAVTQLSAKIRAVAYVAATTNDEDIRQAATALVEDATEQMNAFIKTAQTDLMKEAGTKFAESTTSGFTEGFSALFKGEKTVKEFLLDQVDKFTKGVLDAFLAGLTAPLTDENGPVKTWLKEQGKALFQLGAQAFGYVAPAAIKPTATADTPWLIKMSATLDSILLAVSGDQAMSTLGYLRGFGSESLGRQVLSGSSGVFGKDVFSTGFDSLWKSNAAKEMTSVVSTGFDDVFKGVTDSTKDFGDSMVDITSTLGSDFSGVTDSIGSIFKMGFSFISSMFADGGIVSYAGGGRIRGAGTGRSDSILARVSNGEYIVNAAKTAMYKPLLDAINYGSGIPAFANGGMYGQTALQSAVAQRDAEMSSNARIEQTFHVNVTGDVSRQTRNEIRQMIPEIAMGANIYNKEKNYR